VRFDPPRALDGGADGLDAYRAIVPRALAVLAPGGWLALEIGQGQEADVLAIVNQSERSEIAGERQSWRDLGGCTRCVAIQAQVSEQSKKPLGIGR
jgi:release factor glutamine methyltransferase